MLGKLHWGGGGGHWKPGSTLASKNPNCLPLVVVLFTCFGWQDIYVLWMVMDEWSMVVGGG